MFMSNAGMAKLVDSSEFDAAKKTISATKLNEGDRLFGVYKTDAFVPEGDIIESHQHIILQSAKGYMLTFELKEIPEKKKGAVGVRSMKLENQDVIDEVYLLSEGSDVTIEVNGKEISLAKMKLGHRDQKGTKVRK